MGRRFLTLSFLLALSLAAYSQEFMVQVAAFSEDVESWYFTSRGVEGVYRELDHNMIRRYYLGPYDNEEFAERMAAQVRTAGFKYARVINMTAVREQCALSCAQGESTYTPVDISAVGKSDMFVRNLFFDFDRSDLRPASVEELEKLYTILTQNPNYKVEMHAHTDWIGSDDYNDALSLRRGYKARQYLIRKGIAASRMTVEKFGERNPVALNETQDGRDSEYGRQLNRRVELRIVDESGQILWDASQTLDVPFDLKQK